MKSADAFYLKLKTDWLITQGIVGFLSNTTATNLNIFSSRAGKKEFLYFFNCEGHSRSSLCIIHWPQDNQLLRL